MNTVSKPILTALLLGAAWLPCSAATAGNCATFHFTGATAQPAHNMPFIGEMTLVDLQTGAVDTAEVATMLLGAVSPDGSRVVTSHEVRGGGYAFVTFDDAQLLPTATPGSFALLSHMKIKTGQGAYSCGELVTDGQASTVSFDGDGLGSADYSGFARLCRCKPADN
jgi:hypothetical protein